MNGLINVTKHTFFLHRYPNEDILVHELSHGVHLVGATFVIPGFERRLQEAYHRAQTAGLWVNHYAGTNVMEYWVGETFGDKIHPVKILFYHNMGYYSYTYYRNL